SYKAESRNFREQLAQSYENRAAFTLADQEQTSLSNTPTEPPANVFFAGNAYDFILYVCRNQKVELSVDPELLPELAQTKIEIVTPPGKSGMELLAEQFKPRGYAFVEAGLTPQRKVTFLTHPAESAYFAAFGQLKKRDFTGAYE